MSRVYCESVKVLSGMNTKLKVKIRISTLENPPTYSLNISLVYAKKVINGACVLDGLLVGCTMPYLSSVYK